MQGAVAIAEPAFSAQRRAMVDGQIRTFDVTDQAVIRAFSVVPREMFLPMDLRHLAYSDAMLNDGPSRVMMQPMHLARLLQGASIQAADRVLVVAGGSGYAAAILAHLAARVVTVEANADLTAGAAAALTGLGVKTVEAVTGDLARGYPAGAPFDVILIHGAVETNLTALFDQLSPTGCLVTITVAAGDTSRRIGKAIRFQRIAGDVSERFLFDATAPVIAEFRTIGKFVF